jgi:beta-xylosidase
MICQRLLLFSFCALCLLSANESPAQKAQNPVIFADVPDMSMMRVGDTYYMSSTTMHMAPGVPVMTSKDLINWKITSYCYDILDDVDALNLVNGKSTYGRGTWASSIRYHKGLFYVSTFAQTTNKTYIYTTDDPEKGEWKKTSFAPAYHDHSLFFDDDGRIYFIWGVGRLRIIELEADLSGVKEETERVLIENASAPAGSPMGLQSEGSQLFKVNGRYYLFNICWPRGGMRTVVIHRASSLEGPWEGRLALQDKGVAQGGMVNTPDERWFAYLFRDYGSVGRIPYLVPIQWQDGWPVLGIEGKVPDELDLPTGKGLKPGIVNDDEFNRKAGEPELPLVWQWNHNPDNSLWSLSERPGYLRLKTGRIDKSFLLARNTLTQRSFGPHSSGSTLLDVSGMKDGDVAGLVALQRKFGQVGVKMEGGNKYIFMTSNKTDTPTEIERLPLKKKKVYLRIDCDYREMTDLARFYYSLNGKTWKEIGRPLKMEYTLVEHFMGYRFGLFNYATKQSGGWADFDYFHIDGQIIENNEQ